MGLSLATLLNAYVAHAQNPPVSILDEGTTQGIPVYKIDCVGSGIACTHSGTTGTLTVSGTGGSGDAVSIDGVEVTDPDFVSSGDIDFTDTSNTVTADLNADVVDQSKIADDAIQEEHFKAVDSANDEECLTYETTTGDFEWEPCLNSQTYTVLQEDGVTLSSSSPTLDLDSSDFTISEGSPDEFDITINNSGITITESQISDLQSYLTSESNDLSSTVTWANVPDANITESSVTQHESALTITESQISDLSHTVDTNLTEEEVEDFVGSMLGGTETRISVTYDDGGNAINFVVDDMNDDVPESGDFGAADDLEASGELSADVVDQSKIADNAVQEEHLKAVDTASDEECLTYESTTGDFEWQSCGAGAEVNDLTAAVTWANVPDANITESSVTQHESALTITESQISDLSHTTDTNANTVCTGTTTYLDGEGNCDDISSVYEPTIGADSLTHADIADADQADTKCIRFEDPTADDDFESIWANKTANDFLLTEIWAESDQTVTFMLQVDDGSPADVDTVDLAPAAGEAEDTSLNGDTTVAAGEELDLVVASVSGTPTWVTVCFTGNWVD